MLVVGVVVPFVEAVAAIRAQVCLCGTGEQRPFCKNCTSSQETKQKGTRHQLEFPKWRQLSGQQREKLQMSVSAAPWTGQPGIKLAGLSHCPRMLDVLDCAWEACLRKAGDSTPHAEVRKGLWCDPSQAVQRLPFSYTPPSLCKKSLPYSFERDVCLSGRDAMALQGMPFPACIAPSPEFADRECRALAGEAFFLPHMLTVAYVYYLNPQAPWNRRGAT